MSNTSSLTTTPAINFPRLSMVICIIIIVIPFTSASDGYPYSQAHSSTSSNFIHDASFPYKEHAALFLASYSGEEFPSGWRLTSTLLQHGVSVVEVGRETYARYTREVPVRHRQHREGENGDEGPTQTRSSRSTSRDCAILSAVVPDDANRVYRSTPRRELSPELVQEILERMRAKHSQRFYGPLLHTAVSLKEAPEWLQKAAGVSLELPIGPGSVLEAAAAMEGVLTVGPVQRASEETVRKMMVQYGKVVVRMPVRSEKYYRPVVVQDERDVLVTVRKMEEVMWMEAHNPAPMVVHPFVEGECDVQVAVASLHGQVMAAFAVEILEREDGVGSGPSVVRFLPVADDVLHATQTLLRAYAFTGFATLEFVRVQGEHLLLGASFHATIISHLGGMVDVSLEASFRDAILAPPGQALPEAVIAKELIAPRIVALWPAEVYRDPTSHWFKKVWHDVPWPDLIWRIRMQRHWYVMDGWRQRTTRASSSMPSIAPAQLRKIPVLIFGEAYNADYFITRALQAAGFEVHYLARPLKTSPVFADHVHGFDWTESLSHALRRVIAEIRPAFVMPTGHTTSRQLHSVGITLDMSAKRGGYCVNTTTPVFDDKLDVVDVVPHTECFDVPGNKDDAYALQVILESSPNLARSEDSWDKKSMASMCTKLGIAAPPTLWGFEDPTIRLDNIEELWKHNMEKLGIDPFTYPVVVKASGSCGGAGVFIAHSLKELVAYRKMLIGGEVVVNVKVGAVGVQQYIKGQLLALQVAAYKGKMIACFLLEKSITLARNELTPSAAIRFVPVIPRIRDDVAKVVQYLNFTGIMSFDYILQAKGDTFSPYFLEVNPRPAPFTHLGSLVGADLAKALMAAVQTNGANANGPILEPSARQLEPWSDRLVSLYPQMFQTCPSDRILWESYVDAPWTGYKHYYVEDKEDGDMNLW